MAESRLVDALTELSGVGGTIDICGTGAAKGSILTRLVADTAAFSPINMSGCQSSSLLGLLWKLFELTSFTTGLLLNLFSLLRHVL